MYRGPTCAEPPPSRLPLNQPNSALETVNPERLFHIISESPRGSMKLALIEFTAPEISAGSWPNNRMTNGTDFFCAIFSRP